MKALTFSGPAAAAAAGITYRKLDYWCREGVLGESQQQAKGSGVPRQLTARDVLALRAIGRVSQALGDLIGTVSKVGSTVLYRLIADQVLAGHLDVRIRIGDHVALVVDLADLADDLPIEDQAA